MTLTLAEKILKAHLVEGEMVKGTEIGIRIDQTLTQDATGTMAYLQFEAIGIPRVKTELSVSYIDHNMLQSGFENADDHAFLASIAKKYGIYFSRPGNGICHQVHLERFGIPGKTLLGSDSHTPTGGGIGMVAIGAGGLDVAAAMAGSPFYLTCPNILGVELVGKLKPNCSAKDVILELLRRISVKGGVGKIVEYFGEGVKTLSIPQRATITNMGAELGATCSVFPSDEITKEFMALEGREKDYVELKADNGAEYDEVIVINLDEIVPLAACPHSPDAVKTIAEIGDITVNQVCVGSCTNSSYNDLAIVAAILKGKTVAENVSLTISPGSKQVYEMIAQSGVLNDLITSGARIVEAGCGPCIGMGQSPSTNAVSLRTFNRNFEGRSGTKSAQVYLVSPETAAAAALKGKLTDPQTLAEVKITEFTGKVDLDDNMIVSPLADGSAVEIVRGPNIKPLPINQEFDSAVKGEILLKVGDNITTDYIMPAGSKVLPLRSNIPAIAKHVFSGIDPDFHDRALEKGSGFIVGGSNYGQGSSREHAALAPMYLGVKAVIAKSFARIHRANLINFGILPLTFVNEADYDKLSQGESIVINGIADKLKDSKNLILETNAGDIEVNAGLSGRQIDIMISGGLLNYIKNS